MDVQAWCKPVGVVLLLCASLLQSGCSVDATGAEPKLDFASNFIDLNRRIDEDATAVAYDPQLKLLAVGRDGGKLELWDTRKTDTRIARQAHTVRIDHIAIGADDGIVLTSSAGTTVMNLDPEGMPKVWDARSGKLLAALPGEWYGGPLAASPVKGFYLIGNADELRLYDHHKRVVTADVLKFKGEVSALAADKRSGLMAVGTSRGELALLTLDRSGPSPRLRVVSQTSTIQDEVRTDVLAVYLREGGQTLVSVGWLPKDKRQAVAPNITGQQSEVVQWNTQTWARERTYPNTLQAVHWASYTPGEPWLVLAGNESTRGRIELIDLQGGIAWRYKANTTHPVAVLLPEWRMGLILQSGGATQIRYLDQE